MYYLFVWCDEPLGGFNDFAKRSESISELKHYLTDYGYGCTGVNSVQRYGYQIVEITNDGFSTIEDVEKGR